MTDWPRELKLEVKTSRAGGFQIGTRDIEGVGAEGYICVLLNSRWLHGPRWVLVPSKELRARGYGEEELAESAAPGELAEELNRGWSDWVLDRDAWEVLLSPGVLGVAERVSWCRSEHPPRAHKAQGNLREVKLQAALEAFREKVDAVSAGDSGPQSEGQVHQALLGDVLVQLGYRATLNPVGVPDIVATLSSSPELSAIHERLEHWVPSTAGLCEVRDLLLRLSSDDLRRLLEKLR
jgi:hypothetical protein